MKGYFQRGRAGALAVLFLLFFSHLQAQPLPAKKWWLEAESGPVWAGDCDVAVPGDRGTRFSLTDDLKTGSRAFLRLRAGYQLSRRHSLVVLFAPLTLTGSGNVAFPIEFFGLTFPAGTALRSVYRFHSYRMSYRYSLKRQEKVNLGIGLTAKIRDAAISLEGGGRKSEKTNVGFVPLLNFFLEWKFWNPWRFLLEADALAAPQGRAEDVFLGLVYQKTPAWSFKAGFRVLEGGADNREVYNFAWLNYLVLGATFYF